MSASLNAMRLVLDDRLAELLAGLGVVQRHLVRRPRDADRLRADRGAGALERRHRRLRPAGRRPSRARASRASSFSLPPSRQLPGIRQSSSTTSAVCEARMPCLCELLALAEALACPAGRRSWPGRGCRARGRPTATTTCKSAMPPLVAQVLVPLSTHSSVASSYDGAGPHRADVAAGVGLGGAERAELRVVRACRTSAGPTRRSARRCRWRARRRRRARCRRWTGRCRRHPRTAPPWRSGCRGRSRRTTAWRRSRGSRARSCGLLEDRPRGLLALVPLGAPPGGSTSAANSCSQSRSRGGPRPSVEEEARAHSLAVQSGRIVPTTCSVPLVALRTAKSQPPPACAVDSVTVDGRNSGLRKLTSTAQRVGQPAGQRAQHARLHPHAVRDRPLEPERLRGQPRQVDRVHVAGDLRVAPAGVVRDPPGGRHPLEVADGHLDRRPPARPRAPSRRGTGRSTSTARPPRRPTVTVARRSTAAPLRCWAKFSAQTSRSSGSSAPIARSTSIRLRTCTSPGSASGNERSLISAICSGNVSMCG